MPQSVRIGRARVQQYLYGPGTPDGLVVDQIYYSETHQSTDTKLGSSNPNWRARVRALTQAGSAYSRDTVLHGFFTGRQTGEYRFANVPLRLSKDVSSGQIFAGPDVPLAADFSSLDIQARLNFISKCRKSQRSFQGGVFLGELREAIQMVTRPAKAFRKGIDTYLSDVKKRVRRSNPRNAARVASGTWLEYVFGWRPLLNDIDSGMAALAETDHIVPDIIVGAARDRWKQDTQFHVAGVTGSQMLSTATVHTVADGLVRYLGCVAWESENLAGGWQSQWGLTLSDFAPTIWELIPYSFLVDYFSNIGRIIDAASFGAVQLRWGVVSRRGETRLELGSYAPGWTNTGQFVPGSYHASLSLGLSPCSRFSFNRGLVDQVAVGISDIRFQVPGIGDWRKWANIAALAASKSL